MFVKIASCSVQLLIIPIHILDFNKIAVYRNHLHMTHYGYMFWENIKKKKIHEKCTVNVQ